MHLALREAEKGLGWTDPNPLVGAAIVHNDEILATGWHAAFGELHAERHALSRCEADCTGATMYVTLEPCCHTGKQPPCTDAIIEAGIAKVVVACTDPNPLVSGKGIATLREAGIEVVEDVLREPCEQLNAVYFHFQRTGRPYVVMKYAMGADGSIGPRAGERYRLTGPASVHRVHEDRQRYSSLMVGVQTVVVDDPMLTCRLGGERTRNPLRIIADTHARIPLDSRIVRSAGEVPTLIACCDCEEEKRRSLTEAGCEIAEVPSSAGGIDLDALLDYLAEREIDSVYVEGGAHLHGSFATAGLIDHVEAFIAPQIIGCGDRGPVAAEDVAADVTHLSGLHMQQLGDDVLLEYDVA